MTDEQRKRWHEGTCRVKPHYELRSTWTLYCDAGVAARIIQHVDTLHEIETFGTNVDALGNRWPAERFMLSEHLDRAINEAESHLEAKGYVLTTEAERAAVEAAQETTTH